MTKYIRSIIIVAGIAASASAASAQYQAYVVPGVVWQAPSAMNSYGLVVSHIFEMGTGRPITLLSNPVLGTTVVVESLRPFDAIGQGINDAGQIVAFSCVSVCFGVVTNGGPSGGAAQPISSSGTVAVDINATGQIAGTGYLPANSAILAGFFSAGGPFGGSLTSIGSLTPTTEQSAAVAINDAGHLAVVDVGPSGGQAAKYANGMLYGLGFLDAARPDRRSNATSINAAGQIVGVSINSLGYEEGYVTENDQMHGLGFLPGGFYSYALDVNNYGQVAGTADDGAGNTTAIVTSGGARGGTMQSVNFFTGILDWTFTDAVAINDRGDILAFGSNPDRPDLPDGAWVYLHNSTVPEPSTYVLTASGLLVLWWRHGSRRRPTRRVAQIASDRPRGDPLAS